MGGKAGVEWRKEREGGKEGKGRKRKAGRGKGKEERIESFDYDSRGRALRQPLANRPASLRLTTFESRRAGRGRGAACAGTGGPGKGSDDPGFLALNLRGYQ